MSDQKNPKILVAFVPEQAHKEALAKIKPVVPTRYVVIDDAGNPQGFYSSEIHHETKIPANAVKITEAQYQMWVGGLSATPHQKHQLIKGVLVPYNPPALEQTLAYKARKARDAGLTISCPAFAPMLFPTDYAAHQKMNAVVTAVNSTGDFPNGLSTYPIKVSNGGFMHVTVAQYIAITAAISSYVASCDLIIDGNPLNATALPSATVSLSV